MDLFVGRQLGDYAPRQVFAFLLLGGARSTGATAWHVFSNRATVRIVYIPDSFLSTPVWAALDAAAAPAVGLMARRAQRSFDEAKVPLLGVMGAFVFAAQMINFPVGVGTSGHLVGSALLAYTLGPAAASVVMTAVLAIQALVFQDGGILALGANIINMAILGVLAGYLPYQLWGGGPWRRGAIFLGGMLSLLVGALMAVGQLLLSGIGMPASVLAISLGLFAVSATLEGAITLSVVQALETMNPQFVRRPRTRRALALLGVTAPALAVVGVLFASSHPDVLEKLAENAGIADRATALVSTPPADYEAEFLRGEWRRKAAAGVAGLTLIFAAAAASGRVMARRRSE
jgi:cobalt/nickel transport system permease protein